MARGTALAEARRATVDRTRQFSEELDQYAPNIEQALPANIPLDRFKRVAITAASTNPDLLYADRRTLYTALVKCAADGLMPDGRDAALVIHNTKVKMRNPSTGLDEEFRVDAVSYMPMLAGIRRRMHNSGEVLSAEAEVVHKNDRFKYSLGDNPYIEHEPPPLGDERGEILGAYAIIRLRSGEVIRDVMDRKRIEQARAQSRSKESLMWSKFYDEGCKKTVLRRASKAVPQSAEMLQRLLDRDDEPLQLEDTPLTGLPAPTLQRVEPEPPPPPLTVVEDDPHYTYVVLDLEGGEVPLQTAGATAKALTLLFAEAARRGVKALDGARESNEGVLQELGSDAPDLHAEVLEDYNTRYATARDAERRAKAPPPPPTVAEPAPPPPAPPEPAAAAPAPSAPAATSTAGSPGPSDTGEEPREASMLVPTDKAIRNGKVNWSAWTMGLFLPKLRQIKDGTDLAFLLGDNEEYLTSARAALNPADRRDLDAAIERQWQDIG